MNTHFTDPSYVYFLHSKPEGSPFYGFPDVVGLVKPGTVRYHPDTLSPEQKKTELSGIGHATPPSEKRNMVPARVPCASTPRCSKLAGNIPGAMKVVNWATRVCIRIAIDVATSLHDRYAIRREKICCCCRYAIVLHVGLG